MSGEEEEDGDGVSTRCWGAEGAPEEEEEVSPVDMPGASCSCSPVASSILSSGEAPSSCLFLAVASPCPAGF